MSDEELESEFEDYVVEPSRHIKLAKAISKLDKTQHIRKPSRDGNPGGSLAKSEFHTSHSRPTSRVAVSDIINILQKTNEHADTGKKMKVAQRTNKTLAKPLEKQETEKLQRITGFDETKKSLGKWNAVVSRHRTVDHLKFPLDNEKVEQLKSKEHYSKFSIKSELEKELDQLNLPQYNDDEEETYPMTMAELIEHRKETARLRAKQSYKEVKARRQGKIKSKKFHRILRKEKLKQQLKEFEQLQKTNPEEALKRLEQLEKTRAQERVSLRHKSTGQWAKNKLVRAKYDKETRQQLAEQLALSKDLSQKQHIEESESENEEIGETVLEQDQSNPWLPKMQQSEEVADFVSGYRKYWEERNKTLYKHSGDIDIDRTHNLSQREANLRNSDKNVETITSQENNIDTLVTENVEGKPILVNMSDGSSMPTIKQSVSKDRKIYKKHEMKSTFGWIVEDLREYATAKIENSTDKKSVEEIFEQVEWRLQNSVSRKLGLLKTQSKNNKQIKKSKIKNINNDVKNMVSIDFKKQRIRPEIDEELDESPTTKDVESIGRIDTDKEASSHLIAKANTQVSGSDKIVDPDRFVAITPRHLMSVLPDMETEGDYMDDDEVDRKFTIAEAFQDDDVVAEFQQDKENEVNKDKPKVDDFSLPGWGSWVSAGKYMKTPRHRRRMIPAPSAFVPRKDDEKDNVIINESKSAQLRLHQVSELPFPFMSVADYEASLRAPIGNTFIPESAHRKLVKPAVIVKKGLIIEPMDESQLISKRKNVTIQKSGGFDPNKPLFQIKKHKKD